MEELIKSMDVLLSKELMRKLWSIKDVSCLHGMHKEQACSILRNGILQEQQGFALTGAFKWMQPM